MSTESKRNPNLDALRGIAFIAVISLNLIGEFRLPFWQSLQNFHTSPGWLNHATDWLVGLFLDQKGFTILTFLFGLGTAMLAEKYGPILLLRRFLFLLVLGLLHMFLVFSGDILTLYALCGLLLLPLLRLATPTLGLAMAMLLIFRFTWSGIPVPYGISGTELIALTRHYYSSGSWLEVVYFRVLEVGYLIGPLLVNIAPRTLAVMLLGILVWRQRGLERLARWGPALLLQGLFCTGLEAYLLTYGRNPGRLLSDGGVIGLALGYAGLMLRLPPEAALVRLFAPLGRVALTTYLTQTVLLGFLFYGYGLGLYDRLTSFQALGKGLVFLGLQMLLAQRVQSGPLERLWRRVTYSST